MAKFLANDTVATVAYALCLAAILVLVAYVAARLFFVGSAKDRLHYLKNYKKGSFIWIYLVAVPLYFFGFLHVYAPLDGMLVLRQLLRAIGATFDLLKLSYGFEILYAYANHNTFFFAVMMICYIVTTLNVMLFTASWLLQRFRNLAGKMRARRARDLYIVVGDAPYNLPMLQTTPSDNASGKKASMWMGRPDEAMRDELYLAKIPYIAFDCVPNEADEFEKIIRRWYRGWGRKGKNLHVVIHTDDDDVTLPFVRALKRLLEENVKDKDSGADQAQLVSVDSKNNLLMVYAFCEMGNFSAFYEAIDHNNGDADSSNGHIKLLNRHECAARFFLAEHPLTKYMTDEQIDYEQGLLRKEAAANVCFVGFGATNKQLFLKMVSDSQYFTRGEHGELVHKPISYHFYDKEDSFQDKNFNQSYLRYVTQVVPFATKETHLPLPDYPADDGFWDGEELHLSFLEDNSHFHRCDINLYEFFDALRKVLQGNQAARNYVIIAFGSDLENIDMAKRLCGMLAMHGIRNTHVFVKTRNKMLGGDINSGFISFGNLEDVYNLQNITADPLNRMANIKSFGFPRDYDPSLDIDLSAQRAVRNWQRKGRYQKESNYYCCLNLRTKLHLLGFDYAAADGQSDEAACEAFCLRYFGKSMQDEGFFETRHMFDKKDGVYVYSPDIFERDCVRTHMAIQEHQRWNAHYITRGIIPPTREMIARGDGEDLLHKLVHQNMTTFSGLGEWLAFVQANSQKKKGEVRQYDYKMLDIAIDLLHSIGYKLIVKKEIRQ